jgi:hypothetical protein
MTIQFSVMKALAVVLSIACAGISAPLPAQQPIDPAEAELGEGFISSTTDVNGTTLHYVRGGTGPAVILLHGFPQDLYEFHRVMPRLANMFTVIAVDLRGIGGSKATPGRYDAANLAKDIHQLAQRAEVGAPLPCRSRSRRDRRLRFRTPLSRGNARRHDSRCTAPRH